MLAKKRVPNYATKVMAGEDLLDLEGTAYRGISPLFEEDGQWFFWDVTWSDKHGPYQDKDRALTACLTYAEGL